MKPPLFHIGQAVACLIRHADWEDQAEDNDTATPQNRPQLGTIYKVEGVGSGEGKDYFIKLVDVPFWWDEQGFAPVELASDEALAALLEESLTPVHA